MAGLTDTLLRDDLAASTRGRSLLHCKLPTIFSNRRTPSPENHAIQTSGSLFCGDEVYAGPVRIDSARLWLGPLARLLMPLGPLLLQAGSISCHSSDLLRRSSLLQGKLPTVALLANSSSISLRNSTKRSMRRHCDIRTTGLRPLDNSRLVAFSSWDGGDPDIVSTLQSRHRPSHRLTGKENETRVDKLARKPKSTPLCH